MTKSGEKPAKSAPVSKKKIAEAVPEAVDWVVEDFAKDLQYFHDVIGLPNVGKVPKDITAEDVPQAEVEKHFGVKAKNDKNSYKKEGVKGIPAEDIHKLVTALDGIEKFQLYSLEIARGLYYERILKRAVNWAACGVDKHKGQLSWRLNRKAPAQLKLPPWKRVEHKYTTPPGLKVTFVAEEEELYCEPKSKKLCEVPGEGWNANDVKVESNMTNGKADDTFPGEGRKADDAGTESNLKNDQAASSEEGKKADDVGTESNLKNDQAASSGEGKKADDVGGERETINEKPLQDHDDNLDSISKQPSDHLSVGTNVEDVATPEETPVLNEPAPKFKSLIEENAMSEESPMLDSPATKLESFIEESSAPVIELPAPEESPMLDQPCPEIETFIEERPMSNNPAPKIESLVEESPKFDDPPPKPESFNKLTSTPIPERKDLLLESWLDIVERNLQELCRQVEKSNLDMAELTARMEANSKVLKDTDEEVNGFVNTMNTCKAEVLRLRQSLEEKVAEKNQIKSDMTLLGDVDPVGGDGQEMNEEDQAKFLLCCSETNALQEAITNKCRSCANTLSLANSKIPQISKCEDAENTMKDEMVILDRTAARLTGSQNVLRAEWSRLKQHLGKGLVHVSPFSMVCPLQSEESYFPITECPVCSLGFFCNNWVPTPCGHCYHPNCLFSLLRVDDNGAPKCYACSEVFHPHWLECWGLPQVNHPEVVKLVDDWGLAEQANSFRQSLGDLYSKNVFKIGARRKAQAAKHKKVTKLYSQASVKKSTQYHETVGRAELINHGVTRAESKGNWSVGPSEAKEPEHGILRVGTEGGENSPQETVETGDDLRTVQNLKGNVDLSIVKIEKGAPELGSTVECISSDSEKAPSETTTKGSNRKRKVIGETSREGKDMGTTAPSPAKLKLRAGTRAQIAVVKSPAKPRGRQRSGVKKL